MAGFDSAQTYSHGMGRVPPIVVIPVIWCLALQAEWLREQCQDIKVGKCRCKHLFLPLSFAFPLPIPKPSKTAAQLRMGFRADPRRQARTRGNKRGGTLGG